MAGILRLRGATSGFSQLQAPAVAGDQTFTFPAVGGTLVTETVSGVVINGNVGINTNNPQDALEVSGNIRFSSAGQGINFADHGTGSGVNSNLLDDYEEGTWTPGLNSSNDNGTYTYNAAQRTGVYTKIGNQVYVQYILTVNSVSGATGQTLLTGLPFPVITNSGHFPTAWVGWRNGFAGTEPTSLAAGNIGSGPGHNSSTATFFRDRVGASGQFIEGQATFNIPEWTNSGGVRMSFVYTTTA